MAELDVLEKKSADLRQELAELPATSKTDVQHANDRACYYEYEIRRHRTYIADLTKHMAQVPPPLSQGKEEFTALELDIDSNVIAASTTNAVATDTDILASSSVDGHHAQDPLLVASGATTYKSATSTTSTTSASRVPATNDILSTTALHKEHGDAAPTTAPQGAEHSSNPSHAPRLTPHLSSLVRLPTTLRTPSPAQALATRLYFTPVTPTPDLSTSPYGVSIITWCNHDHQPLYYY
jgi:hypothetical protein